ncbi:MAG: divergent polysaccharide deacetylase family protein [Rhizobiaceae bacterium]
MQPRRQPPGRGIDFRLAGTGIAALLLVTASGVIAFRDQPFRTPVTVAAEEPKPVETATARPNGPVRSEPAGKGGPAIIKVNPDEPGTTGTVVIRDPSTLGQNLRVAHLPDMALVEESADGPLPIRAADGRRPFDVYARPWSGKRGARIAIVIGGLGVSQTGSQKAVERLPAEVTLAFASGGNSLGRWMQAARQRGHEVVMQIPLEPFDYPEVNPGRNTLTTDASGDENVSRLEWALGRITNYTGVMNYMGARFTADPDAMGAMMAELGRRGLAYYDDGSSSRSVAADLAARNGVPYAAGDGAIDAVRDRGDILKKLDELERVARAQGFAVGTGSAFDVTIDTVASWVSEAKKRGIEIVPISAVAADPERG